MKLNELDKNLLYYLASPYSHKNTNIKNNRYNAVLYKAIDLTIAGYIVISPIVHSHPMAERGKLPGSFDFWQRIDETLILRCDAVLVYMLNGWQESVGVTHEILFAEQNNKPVFYLDAYEDGRPRTT